MVLNMRKHRTILYAISIDFARKLSMPGIIFHRKVSCRFFLYLARQSLILNSSYSTKTPCTISSSLHSTWCRLNAMLWRLVGHFVGVTSFDRLLAWVLISAVPSTESVKGMVCQSHGGRQDGGKSHPNGWPEHDETAWCHSPSDRARTMRFPDGVSSLARILEVSRHIAGNTFTTAELVANGRQLVSQLGTVLCSAKVKLSGNDFGFSLSGLRQYQPLIQKKDVWTGGRGRSYYSLAS
jgi:hypothetical protein